MPTLRHATVADAELITRQRHQMFADNDLATEAAYAEMDASLMWSLTPRLQLGVAGFNLLHANHLEFPASGGATEVPRTGQVELRARF